ncbi:MAG: protein kinase [Deltaproteobacteria bacterium]|nr:protein kinase [Deltaproteobacteria bacterium]
MGVRRRDGRGRQRSGLIAGRFRLQDVVASGGMGEVHRARDLVSHAQVCVKLLRADEDRDGERFLQEAKILSALEHPAIVRYLAHGVVGHERYLVMEWLEGEDLAQRLVREPPSLADTMKLLQQAAEALAYAHAHDVIHRDIKPHNLFLLDRQIGQLKVLDFGIARLVNANRRLTRTGNLVGTPGYLAPETVDGGSTIDGRADVFSLGCVAHECLTGKPTFRGHEPGVLLAKLMLEEPPHLSEIVPQVPRAVGDLIARMLAKNPERRPTAAQVLRTLSALGDLADGYSVGAPPPPEPQLTVVEQRVSCIVMASTGASQTGSRRAHAGQGGLARAAERSERITPVLPPGPPSTLAELEARLSLRFSAKTYRLPGGRMVVTLPEGTVASDQAVLAARAALLVHRHLPDSAVVVALGIARLSRRSAVGSVIEEAAELLQVTRPGRVRVDDAIAPQLATRFELEREPTGTYLLAESVTQELRRGLFGRSALFLGRGQELSFLAGLLTDSALERQSTAVLVSGPAGIGKSRLLQEFMAWLRARQTPTLVLSAAGDSLAAGAPFALLGRAVRRLAGIAEIDNAEERRRKLAECVGRHLSADSRRGVTALIGEIAGVSFPESDHESLRAARQNPVLMADATRRAFEEWMRAECEVNPVLVVLDDMQWGDAGTVDLLDGAMRGLRDEPFMVLALARPDLQAVFPNLWSERQVHVIQLPPLSRRASERLVREAWGQPVAQEIVEQIVRRGDGNPFFLEELVRAALAGRSQEVPEPILGIVQARLEAEGPEGRRVLRAAAVFGENFSRDGVAMLLGGERSAVGEALERLTDRELVNPATPPVASDGSPAFTFAHALIREAAYAMLTDEDRRLGHRLAARWLLQSGTPEPIVLAEHFRRCDDLRGAASSYHHAAEQALKANDLDGAIGRAGLGLGALGAEASGAQDREVRGALLLVQAEAHRWRGEILPAESAGRAALGLLAPGSPTWFRAAGLTILALGSQGKAQELGALVAQVRAVEPQLEARDAFLVCLSEGAKHLITAGHLASADALLDEAARLAGYFSDIEPQAWGLVHRARAVRAGARGEATKCLEELETAWALFEQAGDQRNACSTRSEIGAVYAELGETVRAAELLREVVVVADRLGMIENAAIGRRELGRVLGWRGESAEAERLVRQAALTLGTRGESREQAVAGSYLAEVLLAMGRFDEAAAEAERAAAILVTAPAARALALALLARARLGRGEVQAASVVAHEAYYGALESLGAMGESETVVRLSYAACLLAGQDIEAARLVLLRARERLAARAQALGPRGERHAFLANVPHNAETLHLAESVLGPARAQVGAGAARREAK